MKALLKKLSKSLLENQMLQQRLANRSGSTFYEVEALLMDGRSLKVSDLSEEEANLTVTGLQSGLFGSRALFVAKSEVRTEIVWERAENGPVDTKNHDLHGQLGSSVGPLPSEDFDDSDFDDEPLSLADQDLFPSAFD